MTRVKALLGLCCAALVTAIFAAAAVADGTSVSEGQSASDNLWHLDVSVNFTPFGNSPDQASSGAGTVRVTLPGTDPGYPFAFDQSKPVDPAGYTCAVVKGAYGDANTGFECSTNGQASGAGLAFPNDVTIHVVSAACYALPPDTSPQRAIADVWAAPGEPGSAPDGSFPLSFDAPCTQTQSNDQPVVVKTLKPCTVPNVRKLSLPGATSKLAKAGCALGHVKRIYNTKVKKDRVISQSPAPGRRLKAKARVNVVVSLGKKR